MKKDHPDLQYLLWMTETAGLRPQNGLRLLELLGSPKAVWQCPGDQVGRLVKLDDREKSRLKNRSLAPANQILAQCEQQNVEILTIQDGQYPDRLRNIFDPPLVLYVRGTLPDLNALPAVAVVGQRKATPYGMIVAERLGFQLSQCGVIVVSGLAAGIDGAAHKGAVKGPTPAVAVFGTAIDQCYPVQNAGLLRSVLYHGAAVSEYPPGKKTYANAFPRRNRIISGLSLGVVVAEAPAKSGSLITAGLALDQGRDVFAVPGGVDVASSEGCNELIARGAKLVRSARDILEEYRGLYPLTIPPEEESLPNSPDPEVRPAKHVTLPKGQEKAGPSGEDSATLEGVFYPKEEDPVLAAMDGPTSLEVLRERTGLDSGELMGRLTLLELKGRLRQLPGQIYEKR